jgi:hypothetical protein
VQVSEGIRADRAGTERDAICPGREHAHGQIEDAYGAYTVQRMNAVVRVEKALLAVVDDAIRAKERGDHERASRTLPGAAGAVDRDARRMLATIRAIARHRRMVRSMSSRVAALVDALALQSTHGHATGPSARRVGARVLRAVRWALAALVHLSERPHGHPKYRSRPDDLDEGTRGRGPQGGKRSAAGVSRGVALEILDALDAERERGSGRSGSATSPSARVSADAHDVLATL